MKQRESEGVTYGVVRSQRSTADVIIERDGSVVVRAPKWADDELIEKMVLSKQFWIFRSLAEWRDLNATRVLRDYKNGEGFLYLGRSYRLLLVSDQKATLQLRDGRFTLRRDLVESGKMDSAREAFRDFYVERGRRRIQDRIEYFAPKVGVTVGKLDIRELGNRWASCSPTGVLAFHWKCVMAPQTIIDYIVVHELCHLHHRDHTDAFWNEVDKILPDYGDRKGWLKENGAGLDI